MKTIDNVRWLELERYRQEPPHRRRRRRRGGADTVGDDHRNGAGAAVTPRSHNAARWLAVRWLPKTSGRLPGGRYIPFRSAGWYVVRTCKCHSGLPVTVPLPSEWRAERARRAMLAASEVLGT